MKLKPRVLALVAVVGVVSSGGVLVAQAAGADPCDQLFTSNTVAKLKAYDDCRFDRLEKQIAALQPVTPSPAPTVRQTPSPTPKPSVPTPAPTPSGSSTITPSAGKPGPSNTGVPSGTVLTSYTGPHTITVAGTVIDGKDVTGPLTISAKNVVIKNSKVHGSDPIGINTTDSGSLIITDSEVYGFETGLVYTNFTALRINLHDTTFDGIKLSSNASVKDSWIHNPKPTGDAHYDGIQVQNGVVNTTISGNNIDVSGAQSNTALFLCPDLGPSTAGPLTVTGNWLNGGNFTVAVLDGNNGQYFIKTIVVKDNRFGSDHNYGPSNVNVPITQSGNVIDSTGAAYSL